MSTIRVEKDKNNPYVVLNKTGLNDENLSWKSKGILAYLLSKPDDWKCQVQDLIKHSKDGRDSTYAGLRELREFGYMIKRPIKDEHGKVTEWEEVLYEVPQEEAKQIYKEQAAKLKKRKKSNEKKPNGDNNPPQPKVDVHKSLSAEEIWVKSKEILKNNYSDVTFNTWFNNLHVLDISESTLTLKSQSEFVKGYVEQHFKDAIVKAIMQVGPQINSINIKS